MLDFMGSLLTLVKSLFHDYCQARGQCRQACVNAELPFSLYKSMGTQKQLETC